LNRDQLTLFNWGPKTL